MIWVLRFVLESSTDKAQETAGHYDRNCGRGINLHNYLSPSSVFKSVTVFNLLVAKGFGEDFYGGIFQKGQKD